MASMTSCVDARIPVHLDARTPPDGAVGWLLEAGVCADRAAAEWFTLPLAGHRAGCACCAPRGPVAEAFSRLFLRRTRAGTSVPAVAAVTVTASGREAVRAALRDDPFVAARFRLAGS